MRQTQRSPEGPRLGQVICEGEKEEEEEGVLQYSFLENPSLSCGQRSLVGYSPWGHKQSDMPRAPTTLPGVRDGNWEGASVTPQGGDTRA